MKKLTKLLVVPILVLALVGCGKIPVLENGQEAVVTSTAGNISADELYEKLKSSYAQYLIADLIDSIILNAKYEETEDEKDYIAEYMEEVEAAAQQYNYSTEYFIQASYGFNTVDEFKEALSLNYKRDLAVKDYLEEKLSDKEIENYYKENIYGEIEVQHILISPDTLDGMTTEEVNAKKTEALNLAKDIIKKLNNGEDFSELAKEYSDDSSNANDGGSLGWISTTDNYLEEFKTAAFALAKGKYTTTPVETTYGYHIIYKTDEKEKPSLEDSLDTIKDAIVTEKLNADATLFYETLEKIREDADLEIIDSELKKTYNDYMKSLIERASSSTE